MNLPRAESQVPESLQVLIAIAFRQIANVWTYNATDKEEGAIRQLRSSLGEDFLRERVHNVPLDPGKSDRLDVALLQVVRAANRLNINIGENPEMLREVVAQTLKSLQAQDTAIRDGLINDLRVQSQGKGFGGNSRGL